MSSSNSLCACALRPATTSRRAPAVRHVATRFAGWPRAARRNALHLTLLLAAGCGGAGDGPGAPLDARRTARDLQAMAGTLDSPPLKALLRARPAIDAALGSRALGTTVDLLLPIAAAAPGTPSAGARAMLASSARRQPPVEVPWPVTAAADGITFELAPEGGRYVRSSRRGAPAMGVRFILYAGIAADRRREVGWVDVVREPGDDETLTLRVQAGGTTWLDCRLARAAEPGGGALLLAGTATGAAGPLTFDVRVERSAATGGLEQVTRRLHLAQRDLALSWTVTGDATAPVRALDLALGGRGGTVLVAGGSSGGVGDFEALVNGESWASVRLDQAGPLVRRAGGAALSGDERAVLLALLESIGGSALSRRPTTSAS